MLENPSSIPYGTDVDNALAGSEPILLQLIVNPDSVDVHMVPAKKWLDSAKKNIFRGAVPYCGNLSFLQRAQIANWFEINVTKDPMMRYAWMGQLSHAHAITLFIASTIRAEDSRLKNGIKLKAPEELTKEDMEILQAELTNEAVMDKAWDLQFHGTGSFLFDIDVDRECLEILEEEMFERSDRAGIAGDYQWGLDAGDYQQPNLYTGLPPGWDTKGWSFDNDSEHMKVSQIVNEINYCGAVSLLTKQFLARTQLHNSQKRSCTNAYQS